MAVDEYNSTNNFNNSKTGDLVIGLGTTAILWTAPVVGLGILMCQLTASDKSSMPKTAYSNYLFEASRGNTDRARRMLQLYHEFGDKKHLEKPQPVLRAKYY